MNNGDLRLCVMTNIGTSSKARYYPVPNVETALILHDTIASEHLLCERDITSNMIYLEIYDECDGWIEWEDDEGYNMYDYNLRDFKLTLEDF